MIGAVSFRGFATALLVLRVHLEAFWRAPRPYLTATKWWVLRKRVRARGQFAPLLAQTSLAYEWWALEQGQKNAPSPPGAPEIVALIDVGGAEHGLDDTFASLAAEGMSWYLVGTNAESDLSRIAAAIDLDVAPWLLPIYAGDRIAPGAAQAYRTMFSLPDATAVYADDDCIGAFERRTSPHFKSGWNPELLCHHDYLTGSCAVRAGPQAVMAAATHGQDWARALVAEAVAEEGGARHLPRVLHHRRRRPRPRLPLCAVSIAANLPCVSAIIPTRNRVDLLATCLAGLEAADYPHIEVIIVDNDSDDPATRAFLDALPARSRANRDFRVVRHPGPFNYSTINNRAVSEAKGELICLLNNDIEMKASDWLAIMATQALRDEVGAVGAQLLYPDGRLQHAGVVIGVGNAAGHAHRFLRPEAEGYFHRHALPQFVSAVTAACLVVKRERFLAVGGLDETHFPVAFNDVDLCLRLNERGWQSLYEPRAVLTHHESVSRGLDTDPVGAARFARELAALQRRWHTDQIVDPFHHPQLSRASEQFVLAL